MRGDWRPRLGNPQADSPVSPQNAVLHLKALPVVGGPPDIHIVSPFFLCGFVLIKGAVYYPWGAFISCYSSSAQLSGVVEKCGVHHRSLAMGDVEGASLLRQRLVAYEGGTFQQNIFRTVVAQTSPKTGGPIVGKSAVRHRRAALIDPHPSSVLHGKVFSENAVGYGGRVPCVEPAPELCLIVFKDAVCDNGTALVLEPPAAGEFGLVHSVPSGYHETVDYRSPVGGRWDEDYMV